MTKYIQPNDKTYGVEIHWSTIEGKYVALAWPTEIAKGKLETKETLIGMFSNFSDAWEALSQHVASVGCFS